MIGGIVLLIILTVLGKGVFVRFINHDVSRKNAKKNNLPFYYSEDKDGPGRFATDTGNRLYFNQNNGWYTEFKTNRKVVQVKGWGTTYEYDCKAERKERINDTIALDIKNRKSAIDRGDPVYRSKYYRKNENTGDLIYRDVRTNHELKNSGCPHGVWSDARYCFWFYLMPEDSVWHKKYDDKYLDGTPIYEYIKKHNKKILEGLFEEINEKGAVWNFLTYELDKMSEEDILLYCKNNDIII